MAIVVFVKSGPEKTCFDRGTRLPVEFVPKLNVSEIRMMNEATKERAILLRSRVYARARACALATLIAIHCSSARAGEVTAPAVDEQRDVIEPLVRKIEGPPVLNVTSADGTGRSVREDELLRMGDRLKMAEGTFVRLAYVTGAQVIVADDTEV